MSAASGDPTLREFIENELGSLRTEFALRDDRLRDGQDRIEKESIERLDVINKKVDGIGDQVKLTNGRVTALETFRATVKAIVAIGLLILPFVLDRIFG